jgi:dipeptidyl-peptidase-4
MKRLFLLFQIIIFLSFNADILAQKKPITLQAIYEQSQFRAEDIGGFRFMKDGKRFCKKQRDRIVTYQIKDGAELEVLFDAASDGAGILKGKVEDYSFSPDESRILLLSSRERLYRHSAFWDCYVFDLSKKELQRIFPTGKILYPSFSPDGQKLAFVFENNLYSFDLINGILLQITTDGLKNQIINGSSDWLYEEEFVLTRAYEWSPDSRNILFIRTDESRVKEFTLDFFKDGPYPELYKYKYPKVGEDNSQLTVWNYSFDKKKSERILVQSEMNGVEGYIPRIKWTSTRDLACITWLNRDQNLLRLYLANINTDSVKVVYEEQNPYYIEPVDQLYFLKDGSSFLWVSEKEGTTGLFRFGMDGKFLSRITPEGMELTEYYGYNESDKRVYFQLSTVDGLERQIYSADLKGNQLKQISSGPGVHDAQFGQGALYLIHTHSTSNRPPVYSIRDLNGKLIRTVEDNSELVSRLENYQISPVKLFQIPNRNGDKLNALMIQPSDFDSTRKYPVLMYLYGGPGSQEVMNKWNSFRYYGWLQMIAQNGYVVCVVDNRGTGGRGEIFKKITYRQLGKFETEDQIDAARFLASQPFLHKDRIGIFGWSYGGYMSTLCLLKGNDVFKAAIAVAPVTNWKWYNTAYTERYMGNVLTNPSGYKDNSPVYFADRLKGDYLLLHGMADDNVHFQNAAEMANALIRHNKQFETYFYPNRNHRISGENATLHLFTKMTNFIYEKI